VKFVVSCNVVDCPVITGGGGGAGADFYPVFLDTSDGPTTPTDNVQTVTTFCPAGTIVSPCLVSNGRRTVSEGGGTNFYQSTIEVPFFSEPKIMH
jgi:hypothetical protein